MRSPDSFLSPPSCGKRVCANCRGNRTDTAVTDDPDDFTRQRYRLRQVLAGRQTELFICCTMCIIALFLASRTHADLRSGARTGTTKVRPILPISPP